MMCFTIDTDWAPDEIIEDTLQIFQEHKVKCTIFATHESSFLKKCNLELFEIGIHPNFNDILLGKSTKNPNQIIDDLLKIYPQAKGVRSHSLTCNSYLLIEFWKRGLLYDANLFLPYQPILKPFRLWNNLYRVSFNWEDDIHFMFGYSFKTPRLDLSRDCIFNFHPMHVYLNTESMERYAKAKQYYHEPAALREMRNEQAPGTRDLLVQMLQHVKQHKILNYNISEYLNLA